MVSWPRILLRTRLLRTFACHAGNPGYRAHGPSRAAAAVFLRRLSYQDESRVRLNVQDAVTSTEAMRMKHVLRDAVCQDRGDSGESDRTGWSLNDRGRADDVRRWFVTLHEQRLNAREFKETVEVVKQAERKMHQYLSMVERGLCELRTDVVAAFRAAVTHGCFVQWEANNRDRLQSIRYRFWHQLHLKVDRRREHYLELKSCLQEEVPIWHRLSIKVPQN